uniref:Kelch-like family member 33 n=1 Tax=Neogobius melanostomus TaxID=47308 RepID=A0A8C6TNC4_9GOBI
LAMCLLPKPNSKVQLRVRRMLFFFNLFHLFVTRKCNVHKKTIDHDKTCLFFLFTVHRVILAACSDYFRAMFTLGMKESSQSSIYLRFLSAVELEALLDSSYSGTVSLSWNCIFEITTTALQLQYQPVLDLCLKFLQTEINPHSCLDVASFAEAFGMLKLLESAEDYILRQFQKVARTPKFKDLPARNLFKYLSSFALCVPSELIVFRAVVDWIQAKPKRRLKLAKELMKTIHFPLMTFTDFKEVQALKMWSNHSLQELYEAIFEDFCSNGSETQNKCRIYVPKESLVLSGGDQISEDLGTRSISKDLWFGNSLRNHTGIKKAMEWRRLGEMPQPARFSHEVAVLNGHLYIIGGKKYYDNTAQHKNRVYFFILFYRYNPLENSWEELVSMHQARCYFSLVVFESKLYAIGGQCHPDYIDTVERYCPTANSWSFTRPLEIPLGGHVARVLGGRIFVSGGLNNDYDCVSSMFTYDPEKGCTYLEMMSQPRALHCMEVLGECLYVAGGLSLTGDAGIVNMLACEMYNPLADSWTSFPPLPVPHVGSGSAVLEGKFYVLGGYSQEDYSDITMVHRYDSALQQWENMGKMPGPNNDLRACVLSLPEHLRLSRMPYSALFEYVNTI